MVLHRRTSRRQAALHRAISKRGQTTVYGVQRVFCVQLQQCQILPGLPEAHYPQASRRTYAKKARQGYAVEVNSALRHAALQTQKAQGRAMIPIPVKTAFNSVTKNSLHPQKTGARLPLAGCRAPFFFVILLCWFEGLYFYSPLVGGTPLTGYTILLLQDAILE